MRICEKEGCKNKVPKFFIDDSGKKHNCQRRKFCLTCSPYGQHNTKNFNRVTGYKEGVCGVCKICGSPTQRGTRKRKCFKCYFNEKKIRKIKKVYDIVGRKCWHCNYCEGDDGIPVLEFHHVDPSKKMMGLSTREFVGRKWDIVFNEIKKCVLLCCLCHRRYHAGLISDEKILDIYNQSWKNIK